MFKSGFPVIMIALLMASAVCVWAYVDNLQAQVTILTTELDSAIADKHAADRALLILADEYAASMHRIQIQSTGREAILAAPETENAPVAPILERAFRAADEIGGIK